MCFHLNKNVQKYMKIALRPITCYKRMRIADKTVSSLIYNDIFNVDDFPDFTEYNAVLGPNSKMFFRQYQFNKKYKATDNKGKKIFRLKIVEGGLKNVKGGNEVFIDEGFHSYINQKLCNVECVIPRGAMYFKNDTEYVSTHIIFKRILKNYEY